MPAFVETHSGLWIDLENPEIDSISLEDIALGLSRICRFQGQTRRFYSVAEHSILCYLLARSKKFSPEMLRASLFHDAHEAYIGDTPTPLKNLYPEIFDLEKKLDELIAKKISVAPDLFAAPEIKEIDRIALALEAKALMPMVTPGWAESMPDISGIQVDPAEGVCWPLEDYFSTSDIFLRLARSSKLY